MSSRVARCASLSGVAHVGLPLPVHHHGAAADSSAPPGWCLAFQRKPPAGPITGWSMPAPFPLTWTECKIRQMGVSAGKRSWRVATISRRRHRSARRLRRFAMPSMRTTKCAAGAARPGAAPRPAHGPSPRRSGRRGHSHPVSVAAAAGSRPPNGTAWRPHGLRMSRRQSIVPPGGPASPTPAPAPTRALSYASARCRPPQRPAGGSGCSTAAATGCSRTRGLGPHAGQGGSPPWAARIWPVDRHLPVAATVAAKCVDYRVR